MLPLLWCNNDSETLIKKITECADSIESSSIGVYRETQNQALRDEMDYIQSQANDIREAARKLSEQLENEQQ